MKRTLLAVGVVVLVSMMLVPMGRRTFYANTGLTGHDTIMRPFFLLTDCVCDSPLAVRATNGVCCSCRRVIINLFPRRLRFTKSDSALGNPWWNYFGWFASQSSWKSKGDIFGLEFRQVGQSWGLESFPQLSVPESASYGGKGLVEVVLKSSSYKWRIGIEHVLHPKRKRRVIHPSAPST